MAEHVFRIGIIGNPNCGKSTIFNLLTGSNQKIGNWPGVTVESKSGSFKYMGHTFELIDLPGTYSLSDNDDTSLDEKIAKTFLFEGQYDLITNVVDASNLSRNLYLTLQLLEMNAPVVIALNMLDVAEDKKLEIDTTKLQLALGLSVIPTIARKSEGIGNLKEAIIDYAKGNSSTAMELTDLNYPKELVNAIDDLTRLLPKDAIKKEWTALKLLEGDNSILEPKGKLKTTIAKHTKSIEKSLGEDPEMVVSAARYEFISGIAGKVITKTGEVGKTISGRLDNIFLHKYFGIPVFLFLMYTMFTFSIVIGGAFQDFFEQTAQAIFVNGFSELLTIINTPTILIEILAKGVGGGIVTIAPFIPIIWAMYLFLSLLEDSGYMARAAFVMDRFMRTLGLPGKSLVPLVVGFGCNVPSVMGARTLENQSDRFTTIIMSPFMSCTARLTVYLLFCNLFFPKWGQSLVFLLYLLGIAAAFFTGFILKATVLKGIPSYFVMELPNYNLPTLRTLLVKTNDRIKVFAIRAGKYIISVFMILHMLSTFGIDGSLGNEDSDNSVLVKIGQTITPVFKPMGINEDNWAATIGIFTGVFAKEVVVGTLSALYGGEEDEGKQFEFLTAIQEAVYSIFDNLAEVYDDITTPLWISVDSEKAQEALEDEGVTEEVRNTILTKFDGKIGAFAYMLFILLYFPCISVFGAIIREINLKWAVFSAIWSTVLGYSTAVLFYQISKAIIGDPFSVKYIILAITLVLAAIGYLVFESHDNNNKKLVQL